MKKLRFFESLAVVLLAFALMVSCGDAGGGPTTPPVEPPGTDGPQYPAYPGGTGASGIPIALVAETAKSIELDKYALSLKVGGQVTLTLTASPGAAGIDRITWEPDAGDTGQVAITYLGDDAEKSFKVLITGSAQNGNTGPGLVTLTVTAEKDDGEGGFDPIDEVVCLITVYKYDKAMSASNIAMLSWDAIAELREDGATNIVAGVTEKITYTDQQVDATGGSSTKAERIALAGDFVGDAFGDVDPGNLTPYLYHHPNYADLDDSARTPTLTYYALLDGKDTFTFDFPDGWRFATPAEGQFDDAPIIAGTQSLKVKDGTDKFAAKIIYPVPGQAGPTIRVVVFPMASVTFTMSKTTADALDTDGIILTTERNSKPVFYIRDDGAVNSDAYIKIGADPTAFEMDTGSNPHTVTVIFKPFEPATVIGVRTSIATDTRYTVSPLPTGGAKTTTTDMDMYAYTGGLVGRNYPITITRTPASITGITIEDIDQPAIGEIPTVLGTSATTGKITTTSVPPIADAASFVLTWHTAADAKTENAFTTAIATRPASNKVYAKIVGTPNAPYVFKTGFAASDITWGDDIADAVDIDDYAAVVPGSIKIGDDGKLTVILEFTVATQKISAATLTAITFVATGTVPLKASITATTPANGIQSAAEIPITWVFTPPTAATGAAASWVSGEAAKAGTYTGTFTLKAASGFVFDTTAATGNFRDAATAKTTLSLPGATDTATPSAAGDEVVVVIVVAVT